jgi:hypothetical protein
LSGSGLPYRLRPKKHVDRELFAEFVTSFLSGQAPGKYVYISMGGQHLSDHRSIYRRSGLRSLYSFDAEENVVGRQMFNRPFDEVTCEHHYSGELPGRMDKIFDHFKAENSIIWLDFTDPGARLEQLNEIEALSSRLAAGDVLRVTFCAETKGVEKLKAQLPKIPRTAEQERAEVLRLQLSPYFPNTIESLLPAQVPGALSLCVQRAIEAGRAATGQKLNAIPVLNTVYWDTTTMCVVTVLMQDPEGIIRVPPGWAFSPNAWDDFISIDIPDLTPNEKAIFDQVMHKDLASLHGTIGFRLADTDANANVLLENYRRFHRYYPTFESLAS